MLADWRRVISVCVAVYRDHGPPNVQGIAEALPAALDGREGELVVCLNGIGLDVPGATLVRHEHNEGVAPGWNAAARAAKGDVLVFCNDDVALGPRSIAVLAEALERHPDAGVVGPHATPWDLRAGTHSEPQDLSGLAEGETVETDVVGGYLLATPRRVYDQVGGFDERYAPAGFEDFDFALGARAQGRKVFFLPDVEIVHRISMRNPREATSRRVMALYRLRRAIGRFVPERVRDAAAARAGLGDYDPARIAMLRRHYASWRDKWGFDALNPDMDAVLARWGGTEVCWAYDDELRRAGQRILAAHAP
jgi:Glycosyltransferase like family 2